ncbi:MAG: hypothetical protein ACR2PA_21105, partial [Hyphomicrobiaceae bacterium]
AMDCAVAVMVSSRRLRDFQSVEFYQTLHWVQVVDTGVSEWPLLWTSSPAVIISRRAEPSVKNGYSLQEQAHRDHHMGNQWAD